VKVKPKKDLESGGEATETFRNWRWKHINISKVKVKTQKDLESGSEATQLSERRGEAP